jgi:hypothetical protein
MNKILFIFVMIIQFDFAAQSFAPAAGLPGSTAIHKDSSVFVLWANGVDVVRGFKDVSEEFQGYASYGVPENALGIAEGDGTTIVSLGDSGIATLTFPGIIINGPGPDFAIFENGFTDNYMELGHVEVSSNGVNFYRFPSVSETPIDVQITNFTFGDCRYVHNLAGKYRQEFGTPFDLEDLAHILNLDVNHITHVRIIDVVGSINPLYATYDGLGNIINDPFSTPWESSGFDLDAVGVIHSQPLELEEETLEFALYPNPSNHFIHFSSDFSGELTILDLSGRVLKSIMFNEDLLVDLTSFDAQVLLFEVQSNGRTFVKRVIKN